MTTKPRLLGLDLLRFFAVVLVLGRHMPAPPATWPEMVRQPLDVWIRGGWVGVDLFFVLSGFLVSGLLFAEYKSRGQLGVGRFYVRRGWKIYPPFIVMILTTLIVKALREEPIRGTSVASEFLFLQSYVKGLWNHTWSLAVEEHFYLLLPLTLTVIVACNRKSKSPLRPVLVVAALVAVTTLGLRIWNAYERPYQHITHLFASHLRLDALFFGVAISYAYHFNPDAFARWFTRRRHVLIIVGALMLVPAFVFRLEKTPFIYTVGLSVFYLGSGMMLIGVLQSQFSHRQPLVLLATLGAYSYSIYLWHRPMLSWGVPLIESVFSTKLDFGARLAVYFAGSFGVGILMAKLIEVPVLRLRDRWFPSRSPNGVEVSTSTSS